MIGSLGVPELLFILVLALLVFGPRKLPEIGRTLGRAMGEFRRATSDLKRTLDVELSSEELDKPQAKSVTTGTQAKVEAGPASSAASDAPTATVGEAESREPTESDKAKPEPDDTVKPG